MHLPGFRGGELDEWATMVIDGGNIRAADIVHLGL